jgi:hypothetical protein
MRALRGACFIRFAATTESPETAATNASMTPTTERRHPVREILSAAALFAVLTAVFFHPVFLDDKSFSAIAGHQSVTWPWAATPTGYPDFPQSDQANNVYPLQADMNRTLRNGRFPFWSPFSFAGTPTLGTYYGIGFYPPRVAAALVVPPIWVHDLLTMFHVWLAGFALFLLLRRLGTSWWAAVFGGATWMFCPAWWGILLLEPTGVSAALLPLVLWLMHRAVTLRSVGDAAACGLVMAMFVLGATIQHAPFMFAIACLWGLAVGLRARTGLRSARASGPRSRWWASRRRSASRSAPFSWCRRPPRSRSRGDRCSPTAR